MTSTFCESQPESNIILYSLDLSFCSSACPKPRSDTKSPPLSIFTCSSLIVRHVYGDGIEGGRKGTPGVGWSGLRVEASPSHESRGAGRWGRVLVRRDNSHRGVGHLFEDQLSGSIGHTVVLGERIEVSSSSLTQLTVVVVFVHRF